MKMPDNNPQSIAEAVAQFIHMVQNSLDGDSWLKMNEPTALGQAHHGTGTSIRNQWGLWSGSRLRDEFFEIGIQHADDMSSIIMKSAHRKMNRRSIDLQRQVMEFREYWKDMIEQPPMSINKIHAIEKEIEDGTYREDPPKTRFDIIKET